MLNRLNGDSELIVMTAGGMPAWSLLKPLALLALLVALGISTSTICGPLGQRMLKELPIQVRTDLMAQIIQPWRFTSPEAKLTVHIRDRAPNGELLGLLMHDARDPKQIVTYLAERARIIKQDGRPTCGWTRAISCAASRTRSRRRSSPSIATWWTLNQLEQRTDQTSIMRPRQRYTPELLTPDPNDPIYKPNPGSYAAELHERLASPLYAFAFVLLVVRSWGRPRPRAPAACRPSLPPSPSPSLCRILGIACANMVVVRPAAAPPALRGARGAGLAGRDDGSVAHVSAAAVAARTRGARVARVDGAAPGGLVAAASTAPAPSGMGA